MNPNGKRLRTEDDNNTVVNNDDIQIREIRRRPNDYSHGPTLVAQITNFTINSIFNIELYYPAHTGIQMDASGNETEVQVEERYTVYKDCKIVNDSPLSITMVCPQFNDEEHTIGKNLISNVELVNANIY